MPHEFEYFQCQLFNGRITTILQDIFSTQIINYISLFIAILSMLILMIIISFEYVLVLLFRRSYLSSFCCYICECAERPVVNQRKCWGNRSLSLQTKLGN